MTTRPKCPQCSSENVYIVDIAFDVATGEATITGDTLQCLRCDHYFSSDKAYMAYTLFSRWLPPKPDYRIKDKE